MRSKLPPAPNFGAVGARPPANSPRRNIILGLIGTISFCWSNNESLLIYIIMILTRTDERTASIIFGTLNTTRARIDLVERLAAEVIKNKSIDRELKRIIRNFNDATKKRNELIHCMYRIDETGEITHTQTIRMQIRNGGLSTGDIAEIDDDRIKDMAKTVKRLRKINEDIWTLLPELEKSVDQEIAKP